MPERLIDADILDSFAVSNLFAGYVYRDIFHRQAVHIVEHEAIVGAETRIFYHHVFHRHFRQTVEEGGSSCRSAYDIIDVYVAERRSLLCHGSHRSAGLDAVVEIENESLSGISVILMSSI